ncbi:hypothetical protein KYB31_09195 [Clostridium felsineum]|uniref:hypothetical protein n=1 Tax=Clostridium felsineum TaxID=36839 RepID=UPI00214D60BD|nr:hypothetical protein [Clostridium felsineum]MCR3759164.1 hypothetical protein [Clostridium felsineum]
MFEIIFGNIAIAGIYIFIIYSIIKMGIGNERLEKENRELRDNLFQSLNTFNTVIKNYDKMTDKSIGTQEELMQLIKEIKERE